MSIVKKYYSKQASKGVNRVWATIILPIKALKQLWLRLPSKQARLNGNVIDGFGLYQRPLLVSYPRSGTNWIRYIVEYISHCPTPGQHRLVGGSNYCIDRAHRGYPVLCAYCKVLLIIRDYRECLLRQLRRVWRNEPDVVTFLTDDTIAQPASWYIKNIESFDAFQGEKLLIYYEDLIQHPQKTIRDLSRFLGLDQKKTELFIEDHDRHFRDSVKVYTSGGHRSETAATKNLRFHSETELTEWQIAEFDEYFFSRFSYLANKYLSRYDSRNRLA